MSAFIEFKPNCECGTQKFDLLIISRRSRYRQGCRFTRRGIDQHGNVANFVETEQVLIFPSGKICSHVQIRGSIPVLWSSPVSMKYAPQVFMEEDLRRSSELCTKHCNDMVTNYCDLKGNSSITFVNLVDQKKEQQRLGAAFETVVKATKSKLLSPLKYVWYDFHAETRKRGKWANLAKLVDILGPDYRSQRYFCRQPGGVVSS